MTAPLGQAFVEVLPDVKRFGGQLQSEVTRATRGVAEVASGVLTAELVQGFGRAAARAFKSTSDAASKLEQSIGGVGAVFGKSAQDVLEWGRTNAKSFGLSRRAFNEAITPLGALLKNAGLSMSEVSTRTIDLTKRAADMAATFGGPVEGALEAIQAGLRGELDPLERFGVKLNAASVEARALADSGKQVASQLTEQEKATARLNLIMEQTASSAGQFAREADTLAGAQARSRAAIENFQATLGATFNPLLIVAHNLLADLLGVFEDLPAPVRGALTVVIGLGTAVGALLPTVAAATVALNGMGVTAGGIGARLAGVRAFLLGPWGIALGAGVLALTAFGAASASSSERQEELQAAAKEVANAIREQSGVINQNVREVAAKKLAESGALQLAEQLGIEVPKVTDAFLRQGTALDDLRRKLQGEIDALTERQKTSRGVVPGLEEEIDKRQRLLDTVNGLVGGLDADIEKSRLATQASGALTDAAKAARDAFKTYADELDRVFEGLVKTGQVQLSAREAERQLEAAFDDATAALRENGATLDVTTAAGRANQAALDDIASSALNLVGRMRETGASTEQLQARMTTARAEFVRVATQAGLTAGQANELADRLRLIPGNYVANVRAETGEAESALGRVRSSLDLLKDKTISVTVRQAILKEQRFGGLFQRGGVLRANEFGVVGERGPELVAFDRAARIFAHPETEDILASINRRTTADNRAALASSTTAPAPLRPIDLHLTVDLGADVRRVVDVRIDEFGRAVLRGASTGRDVAR